MIFILLIVLLVLILWIVWGNKAIVRHGISISSRRLPKSFSGITIAHISDLHNTEFGDNNTVLLQMLRKPAPDFIAITGDLLDSRRTNLDVALQFVQQAVKIAPVYYATGNHESRIAMYAQLEEGMKTAGATVLRDASIELERNDEKIRLIGLDDPAFAKKQNPEIKTAEIVDAKLKKWMQAPEQPFTILLSHRPELFAVYAKHQIDLVLSGHAHGGQIRLPLIGGVVAPHQGFFAEYDAGQYTSGTTNMVVSRGLGNSLFPFRVNNRPELVVITLVCKDKDSVLENKKGANL